MKKLAVLPIVLLCAAQAICADSFTPHIHGTFRTRAEVSAVTGDYRFSVRTGRVSVNGSVTSLFDYKGEVDLCDRGAVSVTDLWGAVNFGKSWRVQLGQMRMPFSFGSARGPQSYLFANRASTDKEFVSPRAVGAKIVYKGSSSPVTIEGGIFNSTTISDHKVWQRHLAAAAKGVVKAGNTDIIAGYETLGGGLTRFHAVNGGASWNCRRWMLEGEYILRMYEHNSIGTAHAYNLQTSYTVPVERRKITRWGVEARYDGCTRYATQTEVAALHPSTSRLTVGGSVGYKAGPVWGAVRLNYENRFGDYPGPEESDRRKLILELLLRF